MKNWQFITLSCCGSCLLVVILVLAGAAFIAFHAVQSFQQEFENPSPQAWIECPVPHPAIQPAVTFRQRTIHPFLAEYEYRIRFHDGTNAVDRLLPTNTGGRTKMNAYGYAFGPSIRLEDRHGEYLIRLDERKTYRLLRVHGRLFISEVEDANSWGYSTTTDEIGTPRVRVDGRPVPDVTDSISGPGSYLGRIDGTAYPLRFVPAAESEEELIETLSSRRP